MAQKLSVEQDYWRCEKSTKRIYGHEQIMILNFYSTWLWSIGLTSYWLKQPSWKILIGKSLHLEANFATNPPTFHLKSDKKNIMFRLLENIQFHLKIIFWRKKIIFSIVQLQNGKKCWNKKKSCVSNVKESGGRHLGIISHPKKDLINR